MQTSESKCGCPCHKMPGLLIALIGFTFLLGALNVLGPRFVRDHVADPIDPAGTEEDVWWHVQVL
jgi:hypothetical protein